MINWWQDFVLSNLVRNHTLDKQLGLPLRGRPILLSLVGSLTELDSTQSYYHYIFSRLMETTVFIILQNLFATRAALKIGKYYSVLAREYSVT